jgi:2-methylfumaryl-CoA isomerase
MYGAFGRDFPTRDGRRVMVVAISMNQWQTLVRSTGIEEHLPAVERAFGADFTKEEDRYRARDAIAALLMPWFEARTLAEIATTFDEHGVCWGPYQTFTQLLEDDWRVSEKNPVFGDVDQPGIGTLRTPASPLRFPTDPPVAPLRAPLLGTHTDEVLADVLGLSETEIGRLHDDGLVDGPPAGR